MAGYIIVASIFVIQMIAFCIYDSFGVFVDPWSSSLGWSTALISGAYSLSFLMMGLMGIVMGAATDKFSPRLALSLCALFLGVGFIVISRMQAPWQLYLGYGVFFGTGMSGVWSPLLSLIPRWFVTRRGLMTGLVISGGGLGAFLGPPLITRLINNYSWNTAALILGVVILTIVLLAAQVLKRDPGRIQRVYTEIPTDTDFKSNIRNFTLRQALGTSQFWTIFAIFFCLAYYTFSVLVHIMSHAVQLHVSAGNASFILACISGTSIAGNFIMGRYGDQVGPRRILIISLISMSAALIWLVVARELWMLYLFSVVFGFNHGGNATAQAPLVARIFGVKALGTIFGAVAFGFTLGGALGPLVTGIIFDLTHSYQWAFLLCGLVGIFGLLLTLVLKPAGRTATVT